MKITETKYNYEVFYRNYISKSPMVIENVEEFKKEALEDFKEIEEYYKDSFVEGFYDWVKEV